MPACGIMKTLLAAALIPALSHLPVTAETEYQPEFKGNLLELRTYHAAPGKLDDLLARFRDHTCKLFAKHRMINVGYWVPVENPDDMFLYIRAFPDMESRERMTAAFRADPEWQKARDESQVDGKLIEKIDKVFMTPLDFSKGFSAIAPDAKKGLHVPGEFVPAPAGNEHIIEMRTYITPPGLLPNLQARFRDHTLALFEKHGIINLAYYEVLPDQEGADNTLIYFIAHKDMESAKESWKAFGADPEWVAAKKASEEKAGGSLTAKGGVKSVFLKPVDFSPVK